MTNLPHKPTLFIDRNSGGRTFKELIESAGIPVVLHDEHFKDKRTPDHIWLTEIGKLGWIMVTCDKATTKSPLFLQILKHSKARVFILEGLEGASREGKAKCIIDLYEKMISICDKREAPSFLEVQQKRGCDRGRFQIQTWNASPIRQNEHLKSYRFLGASSPPQAAVSASGSPRGTPQRTFPVPVIVWTASRAVWEASREGWLAGIAGKGGPAANVIITKSRKSSR